MAGRARSAAEDVLYREALRTTIRNKYSGKKTSRNLLRTMAHYGGYVTTSGQGREEEDELVDRVVTRICADWPALRDHIER